MGRPWMDENVHRYWGLWLKKNLEATFLKQHAGKEKILGMLFFYARFCLLLPVRLLGKDTSFALFGR